jgi:hypothetical protein
MLKNLENDNGLFYIECALNLSTNFACEQAYLS